MATFAKLMVPSRNVLHIVGDVDSGAAVAR